MFVSFGQPLYLALLPVVAVLWWYGRRRNHLPFSSSGLMPGKGRRSARALSSAPPLVLAVSVALLVLALAGPRVVTSEAQGMVKGRDIVCAIDISGSMSAELPGWSNPQGGKSRRIDAAQDAFRQFVLDREKMGTGDRVGLVMFDDSPRIAWPLTHDLKQLHRKSDHLPKGLGGPGGLGSGTNFGQKGPGPIDAAAEILARDGQSPSRVLVLITDGEDKLDDSARGRLEAMVKRAGMKFYVVGVGSTLAREDVDIARLALSCGGKVFRVETAGQLVSCFGEISNLEQGPIAVGYSNVFLEVYHYPALAGLAGILLWLALACLLVVL